MTQLTFTGSPTVPPITRAAILSPCGLYRYTLSRRWNGADLNDYERVLVFIMLNPSKADALKDDPTIQACCAIARNLGKDGIEVVNMYAYRATDPKDLEAAGYPIGPDNQQWISLAVTHGDKNPVCAWGAGAQPERAREVLRFIRDRGAVPHALKLNNDGSPAHPLSRGKGFIPLTTKPFPYEVAS
jgi:hypothetical protein